MYVDGDFEFYQFLWGGLSDGWCLQNREPRLGIKITFERKGLPSAKELKCIREYGKRFQAKSVLELKNIINGSPYFIFGKFISKEAESLVVEISKLGIAAEATEVPNYAIYNKVTHEVAQIRSIEVYDQVVEKMLENGAELIEWRFSYPNGAISIE